MNVERLGWADLDRDVALNLPRLLGFDAVVGISRGGLVPAIAIADRTRTPLLPMRVDMDAQKAWLAGRLPRRARVLLVDDVVRTGGTVTVAKRALRRQRVTTVAWYGEGDADITLRTGDSWYVMEWEPDNEPKRTHREGYDLDGIICPDQPRWVTRYFDVPGVAAAYRFFLPVLFRPPAHALIVTGRPLRDRKHTLAWLRRHGIYNEVVFNRGNPTEHEAVATKVEAIMRYGLAHFYESSPTQTNAIRFALPGASVTRVEP